MINAQSSRTLTLSEQIVERHRLLDWSTLFEIHPQSMLVDSVGSLRILVSDDTIWMQADPHPPSPQPV